MQWFPCVGLTEFNSFLKALWYFLTDTWDTLVNAIDAMFDVFLKESPALVISADIILVRIGFLFL